MTTTIYDHCRASVLDVEGALIVALSEQNDEKMAMILQNVGYFDELNYVSGKSWMLDATDMRDSFGALDGKNQTSDYAC